MGGRASSGPVYPTPDALPEFAFETKATNYIARMTTQPSESRKRTINYFIKRLKNKGVFSTLYAAWHLGAATEQASLLNIVNSSYTAAKNGTPTFAANDG
jgi:hypothetical protein